MTDITTRADIETLVNAFYGKVQQDPLLGPVFSHVDWPHHLPTMYDFWSSLLLGDQRYRGNPFQKHIPLAIGAEHFRQWLSLFHATVDELFSGDRAQEIKDRAYSIAYVFQKKLAFIRSN